MKSRARAERSLIALIVLALSNQCVASDADLIGYYTVPNNGGPMPTCYAAKSYGSDPSEAAHRNVTTNNAVTGPCWGVCPNPDQFISVDAVNLKFTVQSTCTSAYYTYSIYPIRDPKQNVCNGPYVGDPCNIALAAEVEFDTDIAANGSNQLRFERAYNSASYNVYPTSLGPNWQSNYDLRTTRFDTSYTVSAVQALGQVQLWRYGGQVLNFSFDASSSTWQSDSDVPERVVELADGSGNHVGWRVFSGTDNSQEIYDTTGKLAFLIDNQGFETTLTYNAAEQLISVTDAWGRSLSFAYSGNQLASVTTPNGESYTYDYYSNGMLHHAYFPASSGSPSKEYHYDSSYGSWLLTSLTDENTNLYATWDYDSASRVTLSVRGNSTATTDRYAIVYNPDTSVTVTDPLLQVHNYTWHDQLQVRKFGGLDTPLNGATLAAETYDSNGYPSSQTDFNGNVTQLTYNSRGLEANRIEASGTGSQRTTATVWDPSLRSPDSITVSNVAGVAEKVSRWIYNSRGQVLARCSVDPAISAAMSYTCGSAANAPTGVRQWTYIYCDSVYTGCPLVGLLKTADGPRIDASDITSYAYYASTDLSGCATPGGSCHHLGDLQSVTNALGQVTTYISYDKNGRPTRIQDRNGTLTDLTYNARGWLLTRTVRDNASGTPSSNDATTTFVYDNVGNVTQVTQPDGSYVAYTYDSAHRLTDIKDNVLSHIHYTLDAAGNRTQEQTYDLSNNLRHALSRNYDQLNRLTTVLNATPAAVQTYTNPAESPPSGITYTDGYDGNGNAIYSIDGTSAHVGTEQQYDPLNRLVKTLQDHAGTGATHDTTTQYAYDTRNNLRSVIDPDSLTTSYTYDGLNNLTALSSPDTGNTGYTYDAAGNRTTQKDARNVQSTYTYDALNRLTGITYPTTSLNITYTYDQSNATTGCTTSYPTGRLTKITDNSGSTTYCYDRRGNVLSKKAVVVATTLATTYSYTLSDRLASITYPSGAIVTYTYDSVGRVYTVQYQTSSTASKQTLVSTRLYSPFGPANAMTFGNGRMLTKTYDLNYAIQSIASSNSTGLTIGATVDVLGNLMSASSTIGANPPTQQYVYDPLYRLLNVQNGSGTSLESFTYELTGDRTSKTLSGTTTNYTYPSPLTSHKLLAVGGISRSYDANGNESNGPVTNFGNTFNAVNFTFDNRNRLSQLSLLGSTVSLNYNGRGERVQKATSEPGHNSNTYFSYGESGLLLGEYSNTGVANAEYIYVDGEPVGFSSGGTLYYVETDQLGSPRQVIKPGTLPSGDTQVWKWDYFANNGAFGENTPSPQTVTFNLRFPGQYFDAETGLNYNYFRDYEAGTGRYVESDPIGLKGAINSFGYSFFDPLGFFDRLGLKTVCLPAMKQATEWLPGKGDVTFWYQGRNCHQEPDPPPPPYVACPNGKCQQFWYTCMDKCMSFWNPWWSVPITSGTGVAAGAVTTGTIGSAAAWGSGAAAAWGFGSFWGCSAACANDHCSYE